MFNWIEDYIKAGSPKVSPKHLALLAYNKNPRIRQRVAENPKTTEDVLVALAADSDPDVRIAVGTSLHTPVHLIDKLSRDMDPTVRHGLAEDQRTPLWALEALAHDDNAYVSCRARKTLEAITQGESRDALQSISWSKHNEQCFA